MWSQSKVLLLVALAKHLGPWTRDADTARSAGCLLELMATWAHKIALAKEARKAGQELRKGKPKVFTTTPRPPPPAKGGKVTLAQVRPALRQRRKAEGVVWHGLRSGKDSIDGDPAEF